MFDGRSLGFFGSSFGICIYLQASKAHNMLALMFDPRFKSIDVMKTFVGRERMIQMVAKYDNNTLLLLLVVTFRLLNPNFNGLTKATPIDGDDDSIFGVVTSNEVTLHGLLIKN